MLYDRLLKHVINLINKRFSLVAYLSFVVISTIPTPLGAVDVSNQTQLDFAIANSDNPINIITGSLSLSSSQYFASNTDLNIAAGASLSTNASNQLIRTLSGAGTLSIGTNSFIVDTNTNTSFSGIIHINGESWDMTHGIFTKTGTGTLNLDNATISLGSSFIYQGTVTQTTGATAVNYLTLGESNNSEAKLNISGGTLTFRTGLVLGDFGGQGIVNQTGGTAILPSSCGDPTQCSFLDIGREGGAGVYSISAGSLQLTSTNVLGHNITLSNPASNGTLNISGGQVTLSGANSNPAQLILGLNSNSHGTINQTGGILHIAADSRLYLSGMDGAGIYNLNGGVLELGGSSLQAHYLTGIPEYLFNLGGGTIKVINASLTSDVDANLMLNTLSTLDTNGFDTHWNGVLSGSGGFAKMGAGTFFNNNPSTYLGATWINGGIVAAGGTNVLAQNSAFTLANNTTLELNNFDNTIGSLAGAGTVQLGSAELRNGGNGSSTTFSGSIMGTGRLTKLGQGTLTLNGNNSSFIGITNLNNGSLHINNNLGGSLNTSPATILRGTGLISSTSTINGYIQPGSSSTGTLSFNGNYIQGNNSTYIMEILTPTQYNFIDIAGSATIDNTSQVNLLNTGLWPINSSLSILHADAGVTGQFGALVYANRPLLDLSLMYGMNDVYLSILRNSLDLTYFALTPNELAVAQALDNFFLINPQDPLYLAMANLTDPQLIPSALNSLSGQIHAAVLGAYVEESRYIRTAVFKRLHDLDQNELPLNVNRHQWSKAGFWMDAYGAWGAMNSPSSNTAPLSRANKDMFFGFDAQCTEEWHTGILAGFGDTTVNMPALNSSGSSNNGYLGLYTSTKTDKITAYLGATYAGHHLATQRLVQFPGVDNVLQAHYQAPSKQIFAELGYTLFTKAAYALKPFIQGAYVEVDRSTFRESGGISALTGFKTTENMPYSTTGLAFNVDLGNPKKIYWKATTSVGWQHAYHSINPLSPLAFTTGSVFMISGVPIAQNAAIIDLALKASAYKNSVHISLGYLSQLNSNIHDNGLQGSIHYLF